MTKDKLQKALNEIKAMEAWLAKNSLSSTIDHLLPLERFSNLGPILDTVDSIIEKNINAGCEALLDLVRKLPGDRLLDALGVIAPLAQKLNTRIPSIITKIIDAIPEDTKGQALIEASLAESFNREVVPEGPYKKIRAFVRTVNADPGAVSQGQGRHAEALVPGSR